LEFYDRTLGRRERANQSIPRALDAEVADAMSSAHRVLGISDCSTCAAEMPLARMGILPRLTGLHHHDGGAALAEMLWTIVRHQRPAVVVETGVARGVSSAFILDAMTRNRHGHLWSIDLPPMSAGWGDQTGVAVLPETRVRWSYVRGASRRMLPKVLAGVPGVDLFVHDGLHTSENMLFEMRAVWPRLVPKGFLVSDDADDNDAVVQFSAEVGQIPVLVREPSKPDVVAILRRA
jgi:hypothetical protein